MEFLDEMLLSENLFNENEDLFLSEVKDEEYDESIKDNEVISEQDELDDILEEANNTEQDELEDDDDILDEANNTEQDELEDDLLDEFELFGTDEDLMFGDDIPSDPY